MSDEPTRPLERELQARRRYRDAIANFTGVRESGERVERERAARLAEQVADEPFRRGLHELITPEPEPELTDNIRAAIRRGGRSGLDVARIAAFFDLSESVVQSVLDDD